MVVWNSLNPGLGFTKQVSTGFDGRAALGPIPLLTPGIYTLTAYFSGTFTLNPWISPASSITLTDPTYNPSASPPTSLAVFYNFTGFFAPVDAMPTLNVVKAGSGVPVKFSLAGYQGLAIMMAGYPSSTMTTCGSTATDAVEETVTAGSSSLSYDATTDRYIYVWKTDKLWAGTCRTLTVKLSDGTIHQANFKFTK
jgi:hypothetical protein